MKKSFSVLAVLAIVVAGTSAFTSKFVQDEWVRLSNQTLTTATYSGTNQYKTSSNYTLGASTVSSPAICNGISSDEVCAVKINIDLGTADVFDATDVTSLTAVPSNIVYKDF